MKVNLKKNINSCNSALVVNLENNDDNRNDNNNEIPNLTIDSSQELLENADNMNNGSDGEVPLTIINDTEPINRPSAARGSLSRPETEQKLSTCAKK